MTYDEIDLRFGAERFGDEVTVGAEQDLDMLLEGEFTDCVDWIEAGSWEAVEAYFAGGASPRSDNLESLNPRMRSLMLDSLIGDLGLEA